MRARPRAHGAEAATLIAAKRLECRLGPLAQFCVVVLPGGGMPTAPFYLASSARLTQLRLVSAAKVPWNYPRIAAPWQRGGRWAWRLQDSVDQRDDGLATLEPHDRRQAPLPKGPLGSVATLVCALTHC